MTLTFTPCPARRRTRPQALSPLVFEIGILTFGAQLETLSASRSISSISSEKTSSDSGFSVMCHSTSRANAS